MFIHSLFLLLNSDVSARRQYLSEFQVKKNIYLPVSTAQDIPHPRPDLVYVVHRASNYVDVVMKTWVSTAVMRLELHESTNGQYS
jgi:hypothetical protein